MSGQNALVFVRRNGLIVAGKRIKPARLNFEKSLVYNMEVLDTPKFVEHLQQFFADQSLRHRKVLIVLDQTITFEKRIPANQLSDEDEELEKFVAAMPLEAGKRIAFAVTVDEGVRMYGANYELIYAISQALEANDAKVQSVTPLTIYGLPPGQQLKNVVDQLLKDSPVRKQANFARSEPL